MLVGKQYIHKKKKYELALLSLKTKKSQICAYAIEAINEIVQTKKKKIVENKYGLLQF